MVWEEQNVDTYGWNILAQQVNRNGNLGEIIVSNEENHNKITPAHFRLEQNYPNPFNASTTLRFETPRQGRVELIVYDLRGREVVRLLDRELPPGYFDVIWNGRTATGAPVASGMYFTRMVTPDYSRTIKMVLLK